MRGPLQARRAHIEQLAEMVVMNHRAAAEMEQYGAWEATARGGTTTTGARPVYRDGAREIHRLSAALGLIATALNRVAAGPEPESELEKLLTQENGSLSSQMTTKVAKPVPFSAGYATAPTT